MGYKKGAYRGTEKNAIREEGLVHWQSHPRAEGEGATRRGEDKERGGWQGEEGSAIGTSCIPTFWGGTAKTIKRGKKMEKKVWRIEERKT